MKVKRLIAHLKKLPQNLECVYACDDEGNTYQYLSYSPTVGKFDSSSHDFCSKEDYDNNKEYKIDSNKEVVCIN